MRLFAGRSGGRREEPIWHANLFLLTGPDSEILPPTSALAELTKHGLGNYEKKNLLIL